MDSSRLQTVTQAFNIAKKKIVLLWKRRIVVLQKDEAVGAEVQIGGLHNRIRT